MPQVSPNLAQLGPNGWEIQSPAGWDGSQVSGGGGSTADSADGQTPGAKRLLTAVYLVPVSQASTDNGHKVRYGEFARQRMIIRNPVGSPGNLICNLNTSAANNGAGNGVGSSNTTITPGNELVDYFGVGNWRIRSDQATGLVPAGLMAEVEVEVLL